MNRPLKPGNPSLARAIVSALKGDAALHEAKDFASQASVDASPDELPELTAAELAANLTDFWTFGERRRGRAPAIRLAPVIGKAAGGLDRLEIVQDDAPFLVDSIMGEIAEQGLSVR